MRILLFIVTSDHIQEDGQHSSAIVSTSQKQKLHCHSLTTDRMLAAASVWWPSDPCLLNTRIVTQSISKPCDVVRREPESRSRMFMMVGTKMCPNIQ